MYKIDDEEYRKKHGLDTIIIDLEGELRLSYLEGFEDGFSEAYMLGYQDFLAKLKEAQSKMDNNIEK